jgi:hypothetical protein
MKQYIFYHILVPLSGWHKNNVVTDITPWYRFLSLCRYICRCQNKDGWLKVRVYSMLTALISKNKMIIQSEKQKATSSYSKMSNCSLFVFVKFYLLSLFLNNCCIAGVMIILKINSDPDKGTSMWQTGFIIWMRWYQFYRFQNDIINVGTLYDIIPEAINWITSPLINLVPRASRELNAAT